MSKQTEIVSDLVSTIIPVYNRPEMIVECVDSVLNQTYRPIEIIIVDDGSNDNTPIILKQLAEQHSEIQILHQENAGPGAAREHGRLAAKGEYIQYLDSDDLLLPEKFTFQVTALNQNVDADVAYGKTDSAKIGEQRIQQALKQTGVIHKAIFPAMLKQRWWSTSTALHRRSVTDRAGPWMQTSNEEDWEYDCRIASLGGSLIYVDHFVSVTRSHDQRISIGGNINLEHLKHRCIARELIYQHAIVYTKLKSAPSLLSKDDWLFFSKSVFLLARQCASVGLGMESRKMTILSMRALGKPALAQCLFLISAHVFGWKNTALFLKRMGK